MSELFVIDFDRTLGDTDLLYRGLVDLVVKQNPAVSRSMMDKARKNIELSGGSFDVLTYLRTVLSDEQIKTVKEVFGSTPNSDFLLDGAQQLLDYIDEETTAKRLIMTFGSEGWQELKLQASGLAAEPHLVTSTPHKVEAAQRWIERHRRELGRLGTQAIIIDDKASAFKDLPVEWRGYWVLATGEPSVVQAGVVPENVRQVKDLSEVVAYERRVA